MRPHNDGDYLALKAATKRAVEQSGPLCEIAKHTRLDAATISRAGNPHESNFIPLDVAVDLDSMAGDAVILRTMARVMGYELVPLKAKKSAADLTRKLGMVAKESGELVAAAIDAASDGKLTPNEAMRVDREAADVEHVVAQVRQYMHGVVSAGK